ncbi:MAG: hypothetical protein J6S67_04535 [Methanobrevibacter sp.]|nr:hypothetical protein [Methanobrevibacter sp.]
MTIYEALNWIKEAEYTPCGYIIFNENKPEGQMKGKALKTIFEAAKNDELIPVEVFNQVKKERDNLEKLKQETITIKQLEEMYDKFREKLWLKHENILGAEMIKIGYAQQFLQDLLMEFGCWEEVAAEGQLNKQKAESEEINGR